MRLDASKFRNGLNKCVGIVKDQGNLDVLKSFYLKPDIENGMVYLAGSDGAISYLDKIEAEFDETDTGDVVILPSSKLFPIAKYSQAPINITVTDTYADIVSGDKKWKVAKIEEEYTDVPFYCYDVDKFQDTLDGSYFLFILERLAGNIQNVNDPNPVYRQLYMDGEKAYSASTTFVTIAKYPTVGQYVFKDKVVKALRDMLRGYNGEVNLTYADDVTVIVRTSTSVLTFKNRDEGELSDIDALEQLHLENTVAVSKSELINLINCAKITSDDDKVQFLIEPLSEKDNVTDDKGNLVPGLFSFSSEDSTGADFEGSIHIGKAKRTPLEPTGEEGENIIEQIQASASITDLLTAINIVDDNFILLRYSTTGLQNISISDHKNIYRSILCVEDI